METELEQYNAAWQQLDLNDYDKEWETALEGIVQVRWGRRACGIWGKIAIHKQETSGHWEP
jgi:hypothetical protein